MYLFIIIYVVEKYIFKSKENDCIFWKKNIYKNFCNVFCLMLISKIF